MPMLQPPLRGDATVKFVGDAETNPGGFVMFIDPDMFVRLTSKCQPFPCRCEMRLPFNAVIESSVCFLYWAARPLPFEPVHGCAISVFAASKAEVVVECCRVAACDHAPAARKSASASSNANRFSNRESIT